MWSLYKPICTISATQKEDGSWEEEAFSQAF